MKCRHFQLEELVPPSIFNARGEKAWELLDTRLLISLDKLRDAFGPLTINNWHVGGQFKESCLRESGTATGATFSQHKFGRAADVKSAKYTPKAMAAEIIAAPEKFGYITCIENTDATPTWLHIDCRNTGQVPILVVNP